MKIILVIPGTSRTKRLESTFPFSIENLGVAYLLSSLNRAGLHALVVDGYADHLSPATTAEQAIGLLCEDDLVGVSVLQHTQTAARDVIAAIRAAGFTGPVVCGGWGATLAPAETLRFTGADCLLTGEADHSFPLLAHRVATGTSTSEIPGIVHASDPTHGCPSSVFTSTLDTLPWPTHYCFRPERHEDFSAPVPILGSRGCAWSRCTFCSVPTFYHGNPWRYRSPESLVAEMQHFHDTLGQSSFFFVDDDFMGTKTRGRVRATALAQQLMDSKLDLDFSFDCRVSDFEPFLFSQLRQAGLRRVFLGIEAGNDSSLRRFQKGHTVVDVRQTIRGLQALGIDVLPGYITFEPFLTIDDLIASIEFLLTDLAFAGGSAHLLRTALVPEYGTMLWTDIAKAGLLTGTFPHYGFVFREPEVAVVVERIKEYLESVPALTSPAAMLADIQRITNARRPLA